MLRQRIISAGLAFLALSATQTQLLADGEPSAAAPAAASLTPTRWSGFYVGIGGGVGSFDQSTDFEASKLKELWKRYKYSDGPWTFVDSWEKTKEGSLGSDDWHGFGTLQIGVDHLIHDRFLIGAFADVDIYQDADAGFSDSSKWLSVSSDLELDRVWSVGGRIGVLAHPDFLLYAVGGYTQADLDGSVDAKFGYGPYVTMIALDAPDKLRGYFVGGGGEWLIHNNLSLKLEYRYAKYRNEGAFGSAYDSFGWEYYCKEYEIRKYYDANADFDADIHSVRGALVFRVGRDEPAPAPLK